MNKYLSLLTIAVVIALVLFKENAEHKKVVVHTISSDQIVEVDEAEEKKKLEKEKTALETSSAIEQLDDENYQNDEVWEENIKSHILRQAYEESLDIHIIKEKSLTWEEMGRPIEVDSVKISLRNPAGETSSFRALVDHNTGKILRTWDRPVIDPINPRENRGIKLSPLYHSYD